MSTTLWGVLNPINKTLKYNKEKEKTTLKELVRHAAKALQRPSNSHTFQRRFSGQRRKQQRR
jgi:hypothetical protein